MPIQDAPIVSQWYRHLDKGYQFQVLSVDEAAGTVELQHFDGDIEEMDVDLWYEQEIEPIEPPEDWTGPMDDVEVDDLSYTETDMRKSDWTAPLEEVGDEASLEQAAEEEEEAEEEGAEEKPRRRPRARPKTRGGGPAKKPR